MFINHGRLLFPVQLYDDLSAKHEELMRRDADNQQTSPTIELTLAKSQVDTLQWQLKQVRYV